jgi:hypothetical protein
MAGRRPTFINQDAIQSLLDEDDDDLGELEPDFDDDPDEVDRPVDSVELVFNAQTGQLIDEIHTRHNSVIYGIYMNAS